MRLVIRSGGQSGVDRAALDVAIALGLPYTGWCPAGGRAEDYPDPPGLLAAYPELRPTSSADSSQRTEWNVRDSDATLLLIVGRIARSSGTELTQQTADRLGRQHLVVDLAADHESTLAMTRAWLRNLASRRNSLDLNVAGPRESQVPGIYAAARSFLAELLSSAEHLNN